jgi:hypothetical protein
MADLQKIVFSNIFHLAYVQFFAVNIDLRFYYNYNFTVIHVVIGGWSIFANIF